MKRPCPFHAYLEISLVCRLVIKSVHWTLRKGPFHAYLEISLVCRLLIKSVHCTLRKGLTSMIFTVKIFSLCGGFNLFQPSQDAWYNSIQDTTYRENPPTCINSFSFLIGKWKDFRNKCQRSNTPKYIGCINSQVTRRNGLKLSLNKTPITFFTFLGEFMQRGLGNAHFIIGTKHYPCFRNQPTNLTHI